MVSRRREQVVAHKEQATASRSSRQCLGLKALALVEATRVTSRVVPSRGVVVCGFAQDDRSATTGGEREWHE
ncbi:hypothetical protein U1Q18_002054 [Sarracenia purpurea var. burkii]